jgi:hypothetical protein
MAEISYSKRQLRVALDLYLDVCYFDWNGVRSTGITDPKVWEEYPNLSGPFDPIKQSFGPYIPSIIDSICSTLDITIDQAESSFMQWATQMYQICKAPVSPSECWVELKKALAHVGELDQRKAECPSFHQTLKKIPGSKTKCPHCGKFMYIRTRPRDQVRVVVNQAGVDKIEADWASYFEEREDKEIAVIHEELLRIGPYSLKTWREMGVKKVAINLSPIGEVCAECRKHDGMIINIDEAEIGKNLPPFPTCLNTDRKWQGWRGCRCGWQPVYDPSDFQ